MRLVAAVLLSLALMWAIFAQDDAEKRKREAEEDVKLGKEYIDVLEKDLKFSEDKEAIERVTRIGKEIAEIANKHHIAPIYGDPRHHQFEYVFKVIEDEDVNAFSVPGGFIYVHTGLLKFVQSDDELAGVLAHEVAHIANRHLRTLIREKSKVDLWTLPVALAALLSGSREAGAIVVTASLVKTSLTSGWSQKAENDADRTAFFYLTHSQYSPVGLLTFLERLAFQERSGPRIDWGIFMTHPTSAGRVRALMSLLTANNIPIARSKVTTSFRAVSVEEDGKRVVKFGDRKMFALRGQDAQARAVAAVERINHFFDSSPHMFHLRADGGAIIGKGNTLIEFTEEDCADGETPSLLAAMALENFKAALFSLGLRTGG